MAKISRTSTVKNGFGAMALTAVLALALSGLANAQEPSPPLKPAEPPVEGKPSRLYPAGPREIVVDVHVESTALGYDQGIGPAVGRELDYRGKHYAVADIFTADGQPCFSGGSKFTIAPAGGRLVVGLRRAEPKSLNVASLK
jgi:hypothetical protein